MSVLHTDLATAQHSRSTTVLLDTTVTAAEGAAADTARPHPCPTTHPAPQTAQGKVRIQVPTAPPTPLVDTPGMVCFELLLTRHKPLSTLVPVREIKQT